MEVKCTKHLNAEESVQQVKLDPPNIDHFHQIQLLATIYHFKCFTESDGQVCCDSNRSWVSMNHWPGHPAAQVVSQQPGWYRNHSRVEFQERHHELFQLIHKPANIYDKRSQDNYKSIIQ